MDDSEDYQVRAVRERGPGQGAEPEVLPAVRLSGAAGTTGEAPGGEQEGADSGERVGVHTFGTLDEALEWLASMKKSYKVAA